jgi:Lrp/AsnC family transcriptional regulator for asnA, asnC and gidA
MMRISGQTNPYRSGNGAAWAYIGIDVYGDRLRHVAAELTAMREVLILKVTSGPHDLVALVVASPRTVLADVVLGKIRSINGVRTTETSEIVRVVKLDYQWARLF